MYIQILRYGNMILMLKVTGKTQSALRKELLMELCLAARCSLRFNRSTREAKYRESGFRVRKVL